MPSLSKDKCDLLFSGGCETVCLILNIGGSRNSYFILDLCFYYGHDPDLLLMDKQKRTGLICLAPRSPRSPALKLEQKRKPPDSQTGAFPASQMANWQPASLICLRAGLC